MTIVLNVSKPRVRARARFLASSMRRNRSLEGFQRAESIHARIAELEAEIAATLSDIRTLVDNPLLFDPNVSSVSDFHRDFNTLRSLVRTELSVTKLTDLESAHLTALLSWRVAVDSCRLKVGRGICANNQRMSIDSRTALHAAHESLKSGAPAKEIVKLISDAGFFVEGFGSD